MTATTTGDQDTGPGPDAQAVVLAELGVLRERMKAGDVERAQDLLDQALARHLPLTGLDEIVRGFGLSDFERAVLLLACGPDLVGDVTGELLEATGSGRISFGACLARLPEAHWDALTPQAPLRHWDMVRLSEPDAVLTSPLVPAERLLHHIVGAGYVDDPLAVISQPLAAADWLPPTLREYADQVVQQWRDGNPVILTGPQPDNVEAVAAAAATSAGLVPRLMGLNDLPNNPHDLALQLRRMVRETVLGGVAWLIDLDAPGVSTDSLSRALSVCDAPVVLCSSSIAPELADFTRRGISHVKVTRLGVGERRTSLASALRRHGAVATENDIDEATGLFDLPIRDIEGVAREVASGSTVWSASRQRPRRALGALAQVRVAQSPWSSLVLPTAQLEQLHALTNAVRHRSTVLDTWGFADRLGRGLGTTALFTGPSGTGKTLAAEVIATELGLDLVQVDLSQVVSKYIGETEKQLARLFDTAEDGGMVLLFDEADALFGKRSEVKDSHDRYANLEVGYLLQRLEAFAGLAVLTTNARGSLDQAFTRRLSTVVTFPYPDRDARLRMWQGMFPENTPLEAFEPESLAVSDLAGGGIASAALQAAYLAAGDDGPITMEHLRQAVRWELAKSGRSTPSARR